MSLITTLLEDKINNDRKNWRILLEVEKFMAESRFDWLKFQLDYASYMLIGNGVLHIENEQIPIQIKYSPFFNYRYDRIHFQCPNIKFNPKIHLYPDMTLCLYHPKIDVPIGSHLPLYKIIPWISEWFVFYNQWKKYGVWLGKEIAH